MSLAELATGNYRNPGAERFFTEIAPSAANRGLWADRLDIDLIFYVVLGICAILLALRVIVSAVRLGRAQRLTIAARPRNGSADSVRSAVRKEIPLDSVSVAEPSEEPVIETVGSVPASAPGCWR